MNTVKTLCSTIPVQTACDSMGVPRATFYRSNRPAIERAKRVWTHPAALDQAEQATVLSELNSERFCDVAVPQVHATLLDEDRYLCSLSTMYRLLNAENMVHERRRQVCRKHYPRPELLATGPNQVWSWDITKLKGPAKWTYFHLYVIMDIFSRYVVGWLIAERENSHIAKELIEESCRRQNVEKNTLILHADRGSSMKSKTVAQLLLDLGVLKSHSRPQVSNDNPFSESSFKTLKHRPEFPERFGCVEDSRSFCRDYFPWYNDEHHHSGIAMLTPQEFHYGKGSEVLTARYQTMTAAFEKNPQRFLGRKPKMKKLPTEVWINKPERSDIILET